MVSVVVRMRKLLRHTGLLEVRHTCVRDLLMAPSPSPEAASTYEDETELVHPLGRGPGRTSASTADVNKLATVEGRHDASLGKQHAPRVTDLYICEKKQPLGNGRAERGEPTPPRRLATRRQLRMNLQVRRQESGR